MKKSKIIILIASIILVALTVVAVAAATISESTLGIIDAIINGENYDVEKDLNGDGEIDIRDVILGVKKDNFGGPRLTSLELDGGYNVVEEVKYDTFNYTVQLPAGRPRIPRITAKTDADNATIAYQNATIADDELFGYAKVIISDESGENVYTVKFVRDEVAETNATIALQYDDRWTFTPNSNATGIKFTSSNPGVASVDENTGVITALAVTNGATTPVTISAMVDNEEVDTLTISRIDKAVINLFFVTGQSNAQGCYDLAGTYTQQLTASEQLELVLQPTKKGQVYSYDVHQYKKAPVNTGEQYDMFETARSGFASALGTTWYNLTGEKVYFIQSALSGSAIEGWIKSTHTELSGTYGGHYLYDETKAAYDVVKNILEPEENPKYEIVRRCNFWLQGETCMSSIYSETVSGNWITSSNASFDENNLMDSEQYYTYFKMIHEDMKEDFGIESNNILLVRATQGVSSSENKKLQLLTDINDIRAAQYSLSNTIHDIAIVSRVSDIARMVTYSDSSVEGYGYMGRDNLHYNQIGHNENGITAATNLFKSIDTETNSIATSVEIIDTNGRTRLNNTTLFTLEVGKTKQITAFALPEYSLEDVVWSSSNENVAKVSKFGLITVVGEGDAIITAKAESGVYASVNVKGTPRTSNDVHYRWNFNSSLSSSADANDLRLSEIATAKGAEENYSFNSKGEIVIKSSVNKTYRPDFTMTFPVDVSPDKDWTIEWKARFANNGIILGMQNCNVSEKKYINHIYNIYKSSSIFGATYPLRLVDSTGTEASDITITYIDEYRSLNNSGSYPWKLDYKHSTGKVTLYVYYNNVWNYVGSEDASKYDVTFDNVFGRYNEDGTVNFCGEFDYLDIKISEPKTYTEKTYLWNFEGDLTSSADSNTLIDTDGAVYEYSVDSEGNKCYKTTSKTHELQMTKPFTVDSENSWSIEWKAKFTGDSSLFGTKDGVGKSHLYAAYSTYASDMECDLRLMRDSNRPIDISYVPNLIVSSPTSEQKEAAKAESKALNTVFNTWKLEFDKSKETLYLKLLVDGEWTIINSTNPGEFSATFTHMFGDFGNLKNSTTGNGVNFRGEVDYIKVVVKELDKYVQKNYNWEFNGDLTSSGDENTLTLSNLAKTNNATYDFSQDNKQLIVDGKADFRMKKDVVLTHKTDWSIQWALDDDRINNVVILGKENSTANGAKSFIYLANGVDFTGENDITSYNYHPVRFVTDDGFSYYLPYSGYEEYQTSGMNEWRLSYDSGARVLTFSIYLDGNWNTISTASMGDFTTTFTNVCGRYDEAGKYNFEGKMDYLRISLYEEK